MPLKVLALIVLWLNFVQYDLRFQQVLWIITIHVCLVFTLKFIFKKERKPFHWLEQGFVEIVENVYTTVISQFVPWLHLLINLCCLNWMAVIPIEYNEDLRERLAKLSRPKVEQTIQWELAAMVGKSTVVLKITFCVFSWNNYKIIDRKSVV